MENLTEKQQEFVSDLFINLAENDMVSVLESLVTKNIWFNELICIKLNETDVTLAGTRFDEYEEENVTISFDEFLANLEAAKQTFEFFSPDEGIEATELIERLKKKLK